MSDWDTVLNLVDEKIQEFRLTPFDQLIKRPYRSELAESSSAVCYTLFVDRISDSSIRLVLQAQGSAADGRSRAFAHGFDMLKDGAVSEVPADVLWEFS